MSDTPTGDPARNGRSDRHGGNGGNGEDVRDWADAPDASLDRFRFHDAGADDTTDGDADNTTDGDAAARNPGGAAGTGERGRDGGSSSRHDTRERRRRDADDGEHAQGAADGRAARDRHEPTGRDGAPDKPGDMPKAGWVAILKRAVKQFKHDDVTDRAAALTYYGVLAIFPGVLALVSVLGLLGKSSTQSILSNVKQISPGAVSSVLNSVIGQVQGKAGAAGIAGIVGIVLALWSASGYVSGFMNASNAIYDVDEGRPIWKTAPTRLLVTLALVVMLAVSAVIVVATGPVASQLGKAFGLGDTVVLVWDIAKWPVLIVLVSLMFSLLYKACPNVKQPGFRWISLGGVIGVVVWVLASALFAVYVSFSGSYNKTYGSFATIIIFLVWLWISNIALLLGAEFNAEAQRERAIRAGLPDDVDQFVELRDTRKLDDPQKREADEAAQIRQRTMTEDPNRARKN